MKETKSHWEKFYKGFRNLEPSSFAIDCVKNFGLKNKVVFDLGCGNGRDTLFIAENNIVIGVEQCKVKTKETENCIFFDNQSIKSFIGKVKKKDSFNFSIYCRFLFHAIDEKLEDDILKWAGKNCQMIFAEFRTDKGKLPDKGHYRRLINSDNFIGKLRKAGFKLDYFIEKNNLSPKKNDNPVLARIVAINKKYENSIKS